MAANALCPLGEGDNIEKFGGVLGMGDGRFQGVDNMISVERKEG